MCTGVSYQERVVFLRTYQKNFFDGYSLKRPLSRGYLGQNLLLQITNNPQSVCSPVLPVMLALSLPCLEVSGNCYAIANTNKPQRSTMPMLQRRNPAWSPADRTPNKSKEADNCFLKHPPSAFLPALQQRRTPETVHFVKKPGDLSSSLWTQGQKERTVPQAVI